MTVYVQIQPNTLVLPYRRAGTYPLLLPFLPFSVRLLALRQHVCLLHINRRHPTSKRSQRFVMDLNRIHLPVLDASLSLPLVDAIQLYSLRWS